MKTRLIISLLTLASLLSAQDNTLPKLRLLEKPRLLSNEFVGSQHKDVNGRIAAALKIISDMEGFAYKSNNGIIKVDRLPGVDLLYVQPDERILRVYKTGYGEFLIVLLDEGVSLRERQVWELKISGDKKPVNVTILTQPADAEKILDGESLGAGESFKIVPGEHELRIRKEGYRGETRRITVTEDQTLFRDIVLKQIDVTPVTITTIPDGASVYLNGVLRGQSYWSDFLFPETYELKIVKPGYLDIVENLTIKEDVQNDLSYTLTRNSAILNVTVQPADAEILIDNQPYSPGRIELLPGEHQITVMKSGYLSLSETVNLKLGESIQKSYTLVKNTGFLSVSVVPADAELFINKRSYGQQRSIELAPGSYRLELVHPHYFEETDNIQVSRGESAHKSYSLKMKSGSLQFKALPNNASVLMNDAAGKVYERWNGLKLLNQVPVGAYSLYVSHPDYLPDTRNILIEHEKRTAIEVSLMTYEGSIQQEIDAQKRWRNLSWLGSAALGIGSAGLKAYSMMRYSDYEAAQSTPSAEDLYKQANQLHKISGYVAIGAGIALTPSIKFQLDINKLNKKLTLER
ncbi:MAG TPA: PEGA domain-containing protein [Candidatus Marinimicrobia bacterium]|nr:PEGA domain-containing protein [Candidatus Neomarinimicrobiota bacterium]